MWFLLIISRVLVGSLFIASGLIKANDAIGFSYKMEEYFSPGVLDLPFLIPWSLEFSIVVSVIEVVVGFAVLAGTLPRITSWVLLLMILFFTFLTFYSAYFGVVKDCGCFGDALTLTPWESFGKDVALLALTLIIFFNKNHISLNKKKEDLIIFGSSSVLIGLFALGVLQWGFPLLFAIVLFILTLLLKKLLDPLKRTEWGLLGLCFLITASFTGFTTSYLPIKDFRPYAVGKNIPEQMTVPEGKGPKYEHVFVYRNKKTQKTKELGEENLPSVNPDLNGENWEFVERKDKLVQEGITPPIHDFYIEQPSSKFRDELLPHLYVDRDERNLKVFFEEPRKDEWVQVDQGSLQRLVEKIESIDHTPYFMHMKDPLFIVVSQDLKKVNEQAIPKLKKLSEKASEKDKKGQIIGLTASSEEEVGSFRHEHQLKFRFYHMDQTTLKTIVRSNPGLLLVKEGNILGKWPDRDLPGYMEALRSL